MHNIRLLLPINQHNKHNKINSAVVPGREFRLPVTQFLVSAIMKGNHEYVKINNFFRMHGAQAG